MILLSFLWVLDNVWEHIVQPKNTVMVNFVKYDKYIILLKSTAFKLVIQI